MPPYLGRLDWPPPLPHIASAPIRWRQYSGGSRRSAKSEAEDGGEGNLHGRVTRMVYVDRPGYLEPPTSDVASERDCSISGRPVGLAVYH